MNTTYRIETIRVTPGDRRPTRVHWNAAQGYVGAPR